jgi:hypothetical protein
VNFRWWRVDVFGEVCTKLRRLSDPLVLVTNFIDQSSEGAEILGIGKWQLSDTNTETLLLHPPSHHHLACPGYLEEVLKPVPEMENPETSSR